MLGLELPERIYAGCTILCLGAHSDDLEIGCGGTLLQMLERCGAATVHWIVFSGTGQRAIEAQESAVSLLASAHEKTIIIKEFRDGFFPFMGVEIKECFETLKRSCQPDIIFTHYRGDLHQDHRCIAEMTAATFRNHLILEYEIPKYDGDLGTPNVYVQLSEALCQRKVQQVLAHFPSQRERGWFEPETFWALLRLRGMEANAESRYAEAFYCRKLVLMNDQ